MTDQTDSPRWMSPDDCGAMHMEDPRFITAFSAEEEHAYQELRETREHIRATLATLPDETATYLEATIGDRSLAEIMMVHHRLCRVFPYLSDVITYLCFPWRVELPGHLAPDGKPDRFWEGADAMAVHYGGDAHRRMGQRNRVDTATPAP